MDRVSARVKVGVWVKVKGRVRVMVCNGDDGAWALV